MCYGTPGADIGCARAPRGGSPRVSYYPRLRLFDKFFVWEDVGVVLILELWTLRVPLSDHAFSWIRSSRMRSALPADLS